MHQLRNKPITKMVPSLPLLQKEIDFIPFYFPRHENPSPERVLGILDLPPVVLGYDLQKF